MTACPIAASPVATSRPDRLSAVRIADLTGRPRPTPEQQAVIEAPPTPMLVVAGAGSGKTETMANRVVHLVANGIVRPDQVLGLTFTRKATAELAERIRARLTQLDDALRRAGEEPLPIARPRAAATGAPALDTLEDVTVQTYNGFASELVLTNALRLGLDPDQRVLSATAAWQVAHDAVATYDGNLETTRSPASVTRAVLRLTDDLANHLIGLDELRAHLAAMTGDLESLPVSDTGRARRTPAALRAVLTSLHDTFALLPLVERYRDRKRDLGAIDFSDQITLAVHAVGAVPEIGRALRQAYSVVLLDEFQDTSVAQLELLRRLFGDGHPTCAVGDPQQAIYAWRGAGAASLDDFAATFGPGGGRTATYDLATSWRNDAAVLDAANTLAAPLRAAGALRIPQLAVRPGAGEGHVQVASFPDAGTEAAAAAAWLAGLRRTAASAGPGCPVAPGPPTQAVLVRSRGRIPDVVTALEREGLPVEVVGLGGLVDRPEVADVRALLQAVADPARSDALLRLLAGPRFRIGPADLAALHSWARVRGPRPGGGRGPAGGREPAGARDPGDDAVLADALRPLPPADWTDAADRPLTAAARDRLAGLDRALRAVRAVHGAPLVDVVVTAERALGLDAELLADPGRDPRAARAGLDALRRHARDFARGNPEATLASFLDHLEVSEDEEAGLSLEIGTGVLDPTAVTVSTMHAAKGLEWDQVASVGWAEGTFPSYRGTAREDETGRLRTRSSGWLTGIGGIPADLRADAGHVPQWAWATAGTQKEAAELLEQFRLEQGDADVLEERRVAYVALTRARTHALLTSAAFARSSVSSAREPSRFLTEIGTHLPAGRVDLCPLPEENLLEDGTDPVSWPPVPGEPERHRAAAAARITAAPGTEEAESAAGPLGRAWIGAAQRIVEEHRRARREPAAPRPERLSASQLVALVRDPKAFDAGLRRPVPSAPSVRARRGTAFHAWLENRFRSPGLLDLDLLEAFGDDEGTDADVEQLQERFLASPWARRVPALVEHPIALRLGGTTVRGVIDAVFRDTDRDGTERWTVVDWKTGRAPHGRERVVREIQLGIYRLALSRELGVDPDAIRCAFHYVEENRTRWVERFPTEAQLARILGTQEQEQEQEQEQKQEQEQEPAGVRGQGRPGISS